MNKEEFLNKLQCNGELSPKRCTEAYLRKHNLMSILDSFVDESFGTISERIKFVKYGGGYCKTCGVRTKVHVLGHGFGEYCKEHFHDAKKGKVAHNKKELDIELIKKLYFEENKTILEISKIIGGVSNVTITKQLKKLGIELRSHSENQKGRSTQIPFQSFADKKPDVIKMYSEGATLVDIARYCNVDYQTIKKFLIEQGIEICYAYDRNKQDDEIIRLYNEDKKSILKIGVMLNLSSVRVRRVLIEHEVEMRERSENQRLSACRKMKSNIDVPEMVYKYTNKVPMATLANIYECNVETIRRHLLKNGAKMFHRRTVIEQSIIDILDECGIEYITNTRKVLGNLELDFYIPSKNLAIEVNGMYHHSYYKGCKDRNYHKIKHEMCNDRGIKLYQFWEDDIKNENRLRIIRSMIKNSLGLTPNRIFARKCRVESVDNTRAAKFLDSNHIQGAGSPGNALGLFLGDKMISLLTYIQNSDEKIITRFCTLLEHVAIGGFSKLISSLSGRLKTFSHNDIGSGNLYKVNGFKHISSNPDMWYTDYKKIFNRQKFSKNKLKDLFEDYDDNLTEIENMYNNGYDVIYKSGTKTWILDKE